MVSCAAPDIVTIAEQYLRALANCYGDYGSIRHTIVRYR